MNQNSSRIRGNYATLLIAVAALLASACGTEVTFLDGSGASSNSGGNTGGNNSGAGTNAGGNNTGGVNTGGVNNGGSNTGAGSGIDCVNAEDQDSCSSPGSYCSYYDASTNEYCDAWCEDTYRWQKNCYVEPTYCYNPSICPSTQPVDGTYCPSTDDCEYYECEVPACGGSGFAYANCQDNVWYTYSDCYCYQPDICPASPPQNGTPCSTTVQCEQYDCEWLDSCGAGTFHYGYCDGGYWYSDGDCN